MDSGILDATCCEVLATAWLFCRGGGRSLGVLSECEVEENVVRLDDSVSSFDFEFESRF